ncbi:thermonuclease family protein, partial [Candidatus Parcubacteria bacterium]|nr:thermonuclease family protein [Candidatus Parcubacteria bacterium]
SNKAKEILTGKSFRLEADNIVGQRDKYGRLLRYLFLEDGTNFNKMMINEGYAYEYTFDLPYEYQDEFKQAEKDAREAKVGLWADGVCEEWIIE